VAFLRRVKPALLKPAVVVVLGADRLQQRTNNLYKLCYKKIFMGILPLYITYRRFQNSKAFAGLKIGQAKIFNFSPNIYKLSNSISRDSGDSPDSNYTKYINYGYRIREKILIIFP
jgi:hypothetical protein